MISLKSLVKNMKEAKITSPKKSNDKMIVVTATRGDQVASWDNNAKHGLFTKHLLEALTVVIATLSIRNPWRKL